uniref:Ig-like domain-containing protein n=1 Tax=Gopherus agassizii TaxID=38772 RepID=A0A452GNV1_9SAUR
FLTHGSYSASIALLLGPVAGNSVTQIRASASAREGRPVKPNCQYSTTYTYYALGWYQQLPGQQPLFLVYRNERGNEYKPRSVAPRFSSELSTDVKSFTLSIEGAQWADSAVYFCALWDPP